MGTPLKDCPHTAPDDWRTLERMFPSQCDSASTACPGPCPGRARYCDGVEPRELAELAIEMRLVGVAVQIGDLGPVDIARTVNVVQHPFETLQTQIQLRREADFLDEHFDEAPPAQAGFGGHGADARAVRRAIESREREFHRGMPLQRPAHSPHEGVEQQPKSRFDRRRLDETMVQTTGVEPPDVLQRDVFVAQTAADGPKKGYAPPGLNCTPMILVCTASIAKCDVLGPLTAMPRERCSTSKRSPS